MRNLRDTDVVRHVPVDMSDIPDVCKDYENVIHAQSLTAAQKYIELSNLKLKDDAIGKGNFVGELLQIDSDLRKAAVGDMVLIQQEYQDVRITDLNNPMRETMSKIQDEIGRDRIRYILARVAVKELELKVCGGGVLFPKHLTPDTDENHYIDLGHDNPAELHILLNGYHELEVSTVSQGQHWQWKKGHFRLDFIFSTPGMVITKDITMFSGSDVTAFAERMKLQIPDRV